MSTFPNLKLGKLEAVRPYGVSVLDAYAATKIPSPPSEVAAPAGIPIDGWGMCLNDTLGCCTKSGQVHLVMGWNAEVKENDPVPTDPQLRADYFRETGGGDTGLVEANVLHDWATIGFAGSKILAYAPGRDTIMALHQQIAYYGGAYLGIECPESMQQQYSEGKPITYVKGSPIEGGHCIVAVAYDQQYLYCVTWGKLVPVAYPFISHYMTETWTCFPNEFQEAGRGLAPAIDLATLRSDLKLV